MKFGKVALLTTSLFFACSVNAAVEVTFAPDVETVIVNGNETLNLLENTEDLTLENGLNQIVVRVSKLVQGQGHLEKYRSEPMVITFTVNDQNINIKPNDRIINSVDVMNFDAAPSMKLVTTNGTSVEAKIEVLPKNKIGDTSSMFGRDYLKDLAYYNQALGYAFTGQEAIIQPKPIVPTKLVKVESKAVDSVISNPVKLVAAEQEIKNIYSQLTPQQRKAFLGWAVTQ